MKKTTQKTKIKIVIKHESNAARFQDLLDKENREFQLRFFTDEKKEVFTTRYEYVIDKECFDESSLKQILFVLEGEIISE